MCNTAIIHNSYKVKVNAFKRLDSTRYALLITFRISHKDAKWSHLYSKFMYKHVVTIQTEKYRRQLSHKHTEISSDISVSFYLNTNTY